MERSFSPFYGCAKRDVGALRNTLTRNVNRPIGAKTPALDNELFSMNSGAQNAPAGLNESKI
jgi:hypothetical protein